MQPSWVQESTKLNRKEEYGFNISANRARNRRSRSVHCEALVHENLKTIK
jgi:hypothetical protein